MAKKCYDTILYRRFFYMLKLKLLLIIALFATISCSARYTKIPYKNQEELLNKIAISDEFRATRKASAQELTLDEKEIFFLQKLRDNFIIKPEFLFKRYNYIDKTQTTASIDEASLYLAYFALRIRELYNKSQYVDTATRIIKGIYYLDGLNGFDGYIPRFATLKDNKFTVSEESRTNNYSLLFFGYYLAYQSFEDDSIRRLIEDHVTLIVKYFLKNDLDLYTADGTHIKYSNLKSKIFSRRLDALVMFEIGNIIVTDPEVKTQITETLEYFERKGYMKKNQIMSFKIAAIWDVATSSSYWLNMMKLYIIAKATNNENYQYMFKKLNRKLRKSQNILFTLLYNDLFPLEKDNPKLQKAQELLETYPLELNNQEIINSYRPDIKLNVFAKIVKKRRYTETNTPLEIFNRPAKYFEWKEPQLRVDGNFGQDGNVEFSGIDFLFAKALLPR